MNYKRAFFEFIGAIFTVFTVSLTCSVNVVFANTPYQSITAGGTDDNTNDSSNNNNDGSNDGSGGYIPDGNAGTNPALPANGETGATVGATATNGVGAGTVAVNPQDPSSYNRHPNLINNEGGNVQEPSNPSVPAVTKKISPSRNKKVAQNGHKINSVAPESSGTSQVSTHAEKTSTERYLKNPKFQQVDTLHPNFKLTRHKLSLKKGRKYEQKYWNKRNPKYPSFRDDCTNYASQIMYAEGFRMTPTDYKHEGTWNLRSSSKKEWYMRKDWYGVHYTNTWSTVNGFWDYWTKKRKLPHFTTTSRKRIEKHARPGDVLQFWSKKQGWFHTVTVYRKNKHDVYYTSHTANFRGKALRHCNVGRAGGKRITKYRIIKTGV